MTRPTLLDRIGDRTARTHWLEAVIVAYVTLNPAALDPYAELLLSSACAGLLDIVHEWPSRPAIVAVRLAFLAGELPSDQVAPLRLMATDVDELTIGDLAAVGPLDLVVRLLHAERMQFRKAA